MGKTLKVMRIKSTKAKVLLFVRDIYYCLRRYIGCL